MKIINPDCLARFRAFRYCEWCGKRGSVDVHHLYRRGHGAGSRLDIPINLLALDRLCHLTLGNMRWDAARPLEIVAAREHTTSAAIEATILYLLRQPKDWLGDWREVLKEMEGPK
jgi:hypothetical protein